VTYAQYLAAVQGRVLPDPGTLRRRESAIARSVSARLAHGYGCELPPAYDRLAAQRNARLARKANVT
jgi:hypothetical protein